MERTILQEFGFYDENMLSSRLFHFSSYAKQVWSNKADAIKDGIVYIGG